MLIVWQPFPIRPSRQQESCPAKMHFIIDILPPLVSILHGLRALVDCGKDSAIAEHFLADMRRFVCGIGHKGL